MSTSAAAERDDRVELADQRGLGQPVRRRPGAARGRPSRSWWPRMAGQFLGQFPDPVAVAARGGLVELAEVGVQHRVARSSAAAAPPRVW